MMEKKHRGGHICYLSPTEKKLDEIEMHFERLEKHAEQFIDTLIAASYQETNHIILFGDIEKILVKYLGENWQQKLTTIED